jgi:hypothetical protein
LTALLGEPFGDEALPGAIHRSEPETHNGGLDLEPVVKPFTDGNATWLLTEIDVHTGLAFGLCDLGLGDPELGYVSFVELETVRGSLGLPIERDVHFAPTRTFSAYADLAREHRRIVT